MPTLLVEPHAIDFNRPGTTHYQVQFHLDGAWGYSLVPSPSSTAPSAPTPTASSSSAAPTVTNTKAKSNAASLPSEPPGPLSGQTLVEELLHPEDYDVYRQVAAGEQKATDWGFQQLIERPGIDVLQPAPSSPVTSSTWPNEPTASSDLFTAASLHLTDLHRRAEFIEFNTSQGPLRRQLVYHPITLQGGHPEVPTAPGPGVEVNQEAIDQYRVA